MKAIMVMFDSLNRRMLSPYAAGATAPASGSGAVAPRTCDWVHTPNFQRLSERAVTFTNCFVGSMPCMPARREIHTGRYNFLHRSWGPLEPFDDSMPEILKNNGVYTHLVTDHYHYWEDGGCDYHTRYDSWEISRGQEGDPWKACVGEFEIPPNLNGRQGKWGRQDWVNRSYMADEKDHPQPRTFALGEEFLRANHSRDNWFLTIETFDPHEPYFSPERFKELYPHKYDGPIYDWPQYGRVTETPEQVRHCRFMSAALHSMCDHYLGKIINLMDELDLWKDTMLIVNTDHGFLLGEHDWWAKCCQPFYNEIAHTPLFIWDPRCQRRAERKASLVQTIDLAPTLLEFFGVDVPKDMQGRPLRDAIATDKPVREAGLFGMHGAHVNVTDGRYVYMRAPASDDNAPLYEYTLMPTHMRHTFPPEELQDICLAEPFSFTKGCRTMRIAARPWLNAHQFGTMLFDLESDPGQEHPLDLIGGDLRIAAAEQRMIDHLVRLMRESDAPEEQFARMGLRA